jgi:hypothetical protein
LARVYRIAIAAMSYVLEPFFLTYPQRCQDAAMVKPPSLDARILVFLCDDMLAKPASNVHDTANLGQAIESVAARLDQLASTGKATELREKWANAGEWEDVIEVFECFRRHDECDSAWRSWQEHMTDLRDFAVGLIPFIDKAIEERGGATAPGQHQSNPQNESQCNGHAAEINGSGQPQTIGSNHGGPAGNENGSPSETYFTKELLGKLGVSSPTLIKFVSEAGVPASKRGKRSRRYTSDEWLKILKAAVHIGQADVKKRARQILAEIESKSKAQK